MKAIANIKYVINKNNIAFKLKCIIILGLFVITQNSCEKAVCDYELDPPPYSCSGGMDVVFAIDYTGSMGPAINNIKTSVTNIVSTIVTESGGDYRLALTIFDEQGKSNTPGYFSQPAYTGLPASNKLNITTGPTTNQYLTVMDAFGPIGSSTTFAAQLAKLNVAGTMALGNGAGGPEPGDLLLDKLINSAFAGSWRPGITKLIILITDNIASGNDDTGNATDDAFLTTLAANANTAGIQCILISSQPTGVPNYETKLISANTGGLKLMSANFANIATDISTMIENLCTNNSSK